FGDLELDQLRGLIAGEPVAGLQPAAREPAHEHMLAAKSWRPRSHSTHLCEPVLPHGGVGLVGDEVEKHIRVRVDLGPRLDGEHRVLLRYSTSLECYS